MGILWERAIMSVIIKFRVREGRDEPREELYKRRINYGKVYFLIREIFGKSRLEGI